MTTMAAEATFDANSRLFQFYNSGSCGEVYACGHSPKARLESQARRRYELEPYIPGFARFREGAGKSVLEIGVGMGADHLEWAKSRPARLVGIDLTPRAVEHTRTRLGLSGFTPDVQVANAERLPFADASFDVVYSWGVLHHTPDTPAAMREVLRVLKPGGVARIMIYNTRSLTGWLLWARYALLRGHPRRTLADVYAEHLQSGTKAYTPAEAIAMLPGCSRVTATPQLGFGDLLQGEVGRRHRSPLMSIAKRVWPRWMIRRLFKRHGIYLLVEAAK